MSDHQKHNHDNKKSGLHKDWRTWTALALMLAAMFAYVLSDDESLAPGDGQQEAMEAAE